MDYRDDRETLRRRNAELERELAELRAQRARSDTTPESHTRSDVATPPAESRGSRARLVGWVAAIVVMSVSAMAVLWWAGAGSPPLRSLLAKPKTGVGVWHARVERAEGIALEVGEACRIEAEIERDGRAAKQKGLAVTCGTTAVYESREAHPEGRVLVVEDPGLRTVAFEASVTNTPAGSVLDIAFEEQGPVLREEPYAAVDTARGLAVFTRQSPALRLALRVTPGSAPLDW